MNWRYSGLAVAAALVPLLAASVWGSFSMVLVVFALEALLIGAIVAFVLWLRPPVPIPPAQRTLTISTRPVPSTDRDFGFELSAEARWWPTFGRDVSNAAEAVEQALVARAALVTACFGLDQLPDAFGALRAELAVSERTGVGLTWATDVVLRVSEEGQKLLDAQAEVRRELRLRQERRRLAGDMRRYLQEDALATPKDAVAWWLAQHEEGGLKDQVEHAVGLRQTLGELSAAVSATYSQAPDHLELLLLERFPGAQAEPEREFARDECNRVFERLRPPAGDAPLSNGESSG